MEFDKNLLINKDYQNTNTPYRLGDVWNCWSEEINLLHIKHFPDSIAGEYSLLNTSNIGANKDLMKEILYKRNNNKIQTKPDEMILHIRIGDVLAKHNVDSRATWSGNGLWREFFCKCNDQEWWANIVSYIKYNNISKLYIMTGAHVNEGIDESYEYIQSIIKFISKTCRKVRLEYRFGNNPDDDVLFCLGAKHIQSTGGGYGELLKEVSKL
jgi:hypothetical protein